MAEKKAKPGSTMRRCGVILILFGFFLFFLADGSGLPMGQIILVLGGILLVVFGYLKQIAEK